MEATKLVHLDSMSSSTTTTTTTTTSTANNIVINSASTANSKQANQIQKQNILDCLSYSKTFKDLLSLFDETVDEKLLAIMCDKQGITEQHKIKIYLKKAHNKENFLSNFFSDFSNQFNTYQSAIGFLRNFDQAKFLVQSLEKEENNIFCQIQDKIKSSTDFSFQLTITHKDGQTFELKNSSSQSSLGTDSSNDSDKIPKTYVLFVYYQEQMIKNTIRLERFKEQIKNSNIELIPFDLNNKDKNIKLEFQKFDRYHVFLLYDKKIDDLIDFTKKQLNDNYKNIVNFYYEIYHEYLKNNNSNKRFYTFLMDNYNEYCVNGRFKFHWLLRKIIDANGHEQYLRPNDVPLFETNHMDSNLQKFLKYFEKISKPF